MPDPFLILMILIAVVAVVALLVFGPDRLPDMARQAAKLLARFRGQASEAVAELKRAADIEDLEKEFKAVSADVNRMRRSISNPARALLEQPRAPDDAPPIDPEAT